MGNHQRRDCSICTLTKQPKEYDVWECKIITPNNGKMRPSGFDSIPRLAAIRAIESYGIDVIACFSGWGGSLNNTEKILIDNEVRRDIKHTKR